MARGLNLALTVFAAVYATTHAADDMAWAGVTNDGQHGTWGLDLAVAKAPGIDNLFIANPMDAHDWSHTAVIRKSLNAQFNGTAPKVKKLEEDLKQLFTVLPKDKQGRLSSGTARYALHRHFTKKHGWTIKGLDATGAAWMATMSVTPDVKDITKYMVPSYMQQLLLQRLGVSGFDLHALAVFGAAIEHMIHAEMINYVTSIFKTLAIPVPGKKTEKQVDDVLDTFMMIFALGINLDVSNMEDVEKAREYLATSHAGWPQLQAFAKEMKKDAAEGDRLDFFGIVKVVEKISQGYSKMQGMDCPRAKEQLMLMPSHHGGHVKMSDLKPSHLAGRRSLFTEKFEDLLKQGVLVSQSGGKLASYLKNKARADLLIPNYLNSQNMCLSTSSLFTVCCVNECDTLLSELENRAGAPVAKTEEIWRWAQSVPGAHVPESVGTELLGGAWMQNLHGKDLAEWMHRAFPLTCPKPLGTAHPKTPNEWIGEDERMEVKNLEETIVEVAEVFSRYTTMGKTPGAKASKPVHSSNSTLTWLQSQEKSNVVPVRAGESQTVPQASGSSIVGGVFRLIPIIPMAGLVWVAANRLFQASCFVACGHDKFLKSLKCEEHVV